MKSSFRPSLVLNGLAAWMELHWLAITNRLATNIRLAKYCKAWCNSPMLSASDSQRETLTVSEAAELDAADIRDSLAGDGDAFRRLVQRYQQPIADYLWRFTRDRRQWEELVQDVFVEGYLSLPSYSAKAPLLHWLKRIATRVGYRFWKNQQRRRIEATWTEEADLLTSTDEAVGSAQAAAELVQQMLAELAPRDRLVMTLTYLEQRDVAEVAKLTGWSKSMVKVQLHRARKRLAKICKKRGIEP
ncbi:MAG: RNA polymerase sigma factor [Planctomycetes bacterium]|nr:RNA polymerase sigma factor [Planctomycetota bacterium]